ncbi:hypothetical protein F5J12DRAFT_787658 [Pisolithus orientalis]|uniref:uncharacterized protein n=1 Tax=Pisolithus orientalis TaxID=936130 RepID=UPI0022253AA3|nr:uncharacterized protein F5J12DRAFT_787658 [Pisolithus orientalis]KAI5984127.1 hypothetical protein F5J12DRAFT_787658 [Pisolithus orientalis]
MSTEQSCQVYFHHQANVRPIEPRQSSSHVKQSKNLEEMLVQLCEFGRVDTVGSNMDIVANSCESLVDQFLQEREPTALAEGRITAVIDPHDNLMNWFLNEWEPTAPPVDGMNMDLLKQLLNVWEPVALPVMPKKLNRMDRSSTPAQDVTMQVDFLEDLQNVQEPSPLPITCKSSYLRDQSPQPDSLTNLLAQLQDMREPTPPPLISNVPIKSFDLAADEDNGTNHLTFGMPEQSEMRDLFEEICNVSHYCGNTTPSDMPFDPTLDRHLVQAVNAIARELGTAARDQYAIHHQPITPILPVCGRDGYPLLGILDRGGLCTSEADCPYHGMAVHWFANLAMDLNQLNSLILVTVLHASYTPPLPACYHVYLRHQDDELIPLSAFSIIDNISTIIPHWTPHAADPNSGFAFPWWLYHSEEYAVDSQRLQGKGLFSMAWDFFKLMMAQGLWPLPEVQSQTVSMDILRSRWCTLCGLLGMLLQ